MATVEEFKEEWLSSRPYVIAHTSGSTGKPKEIRLLKSDMRTSAKATNRFFNIDKESVLALPLSVDYIAGKMMCVRSFEAECELLQLPVSSEIIVDRHIDLLAIVPSQIDSLLSQKNAPNLIKNLIIGGASIAEDKVDRIKKAGFNAYATYGMTETCSHVALAGLSVDPGLYKALPGISFDVDSRGCLEIIAPHFSFGRITTNDIAELTSPTGFRWLGRYDNVINSGGIKILPEKLEAEIEAYTDKKFYISSVPDKQWGESIVMVIEGEETEAKSLMETLRNNIDHRICPKKIMTVDKIPLTASGKIIRQKMI